MQQETRYKRWFSALGHEIKLAVIEIGAGNGRKSTLLV